MSGIRETRKKLQRSVLFIVQCDKADAALRELTLLKQTVDSQVRLLSEKLNLLEDCEDAADPQEIYSVDKDGNPITNSTGEPMSVTVEEAARRGVAQDMYDALYGE